VAKELAKIQLPSMMIFGGDSKGGGPTDPFQAIGLESFLNITKSISNNKK